MQSIQIVQPPAEMVTPFGTQASRPPRWMTGCPKPGVFALKVMERYVPAAMPSVATDKSQDLSLDQSAAKGE